MRKNKTRIVYLKSASNLDCPCLPAGKGQAGNLDVGPFRIDENGKVRLMAHDVLRVPSFVKIGHKNGNPYDNRRANLFIIDPVKS